ncbi:MAG TPA: heparan-alpha-glucosaminide N-acetyltransferase domain-containing protein [Gemmatimonadaceae bacterium]
MTSTALRDAPAYSPPSTAVGISQRIASLDIVRGVVCVLMAIDHVRVYSGLPAGGPTFGIFFTRWITHFVAPAFVFLAGTAAFLYGERVQDKGKLARFLVTRGLWLVVLELTVIRVGWTFNFDFASYMLAGVIWMIGWCMVLMSAIIYLPHIAIAVGSIAIIAGHNVTNFFPGFGGAIRQGPFGWLGKIAYTGGGIPSDDEGPLLVLFVLVPWIAVMAAGYAFGPVMRLSPERRRSICYKIGFGAIAAFIALRALDVYGDPRPWRRGRPPATAQSRPPAQAATQAPAATPAPPQPPRRQMPAALAFLNTAKYPASLSFLLMTLGPMFVLLALVEGARGPIAGALETFGRVPFFYYLLHIPAIHVAAIIVSLIREGTVNPWLFQNHPMGNGPAPNGYMWSLPLLYLVWAIVVGVLYVACRWYAEIKARNRSAWLSYL